MNLNKNKEELVKGKLFPRWNALSKAINNKTGDSTSVIMIAGNSELEN